MSVKNFLKDTFKHFNAAALIDAAEAYSAHLKKGGKMFLAMAGAMSTGEIGITLGEMIRQDKIHAISTTGANLEEDIFNLIAHSKYKRVPDYRQLTPDDEAELKRNKYNRVTDTCIPEEAAIAKIDNKMSAFWKKAEERNERYFPYEFFYQLIRSGQLKELYEIDPRDSWVVAASEKNIPVYTPGWEDSTLGNKLVAETRRGLFKHNKFVKDGLDQMAHLIEWYKQNTGKQGIGFFQIGGGIAGDFSICVVPLIRQDLKEDVKLWSYFCQISDSTTSYGSYSGAVPNEKITWEKLDRDTPKFIIESDATIVAPLIFKYVLEQ